MFQPNDRVTVDVSGLVIQGVSFSQNVQKALGMIVQQIIGPAHNGNEYLVEALDYAARGKVKAMVEAFPGERVAEAYERVAGGKVRFRAVVVTYEALGNGQPVVER